MANSDCVFCMIVNGEVPSFRIHESDDFIAVLDISQLTEGHTIVIPKVHYKTIWDVPDIGGYFEVVKKVGNHYRGLGYKYVDTLTFGRMVPHAHVHVVPHNGDSEDWKHALRVIGEFQQDSSRYPSQKEGEKLVEKFKLS